MSDPGPRVLETYEAKRASLQKEHSASAGSPGVQLLITRALLSTDLALCRYRDLCHCASEEETKALAALAGQRETIEKLQRLATEARARHEQAPLELREVTAEIAEQQESMADSMASLPAAPHALRIEVHRVLISVMAEGLADLYSAADRRAVLEVMKILLKRIVDMSPIGAIVGIVSDVKEVYDFRDGAVEAADLAAGIRRYEDYVEAAVHWSILASRLAELWKGSVTTVEHPASRSSRASLE